MSNDGTDGRFQYLFVKLHVAGPLRGSKMCSRQLRRMPLLIPVSGELTRRQRRTMQAREMSTNVTRLPISGATLGGVAGMTAEANPGERTGVNADSSGKLIVPLAGEGAPAGRLRPPTRAEVQSARRSRRTIPGQTARTHGPAGTTRTHDIEDAIGKVPMEIPGQMDEPAKDKAAIQVIEGLGHGPGVLPSRTLGWHGMGGPISETVAFRAEATIVRRSEAMEEPRRGSRCLRSLARTLRRCWKFCKKLLASDRGLAKDDAPSSCSTRPCFISEFIW